MKQLLILVLGLLTSPIIFSQKIKHPSLVFTPERIQLVQQRVKEDSSVATAWKEVLKVADDNLKKNDLKKVDYLSVAYLMTNDKKFADKVKSILLSTVRGPQWSSVDEMVLRKPSWRADLGLSHKCQLSAIAFDAIYNTLTDEERKEIANGLYQYGVVPSLEDWFLEPTRIHSLNSMGHNWWTSCAGMGGLLATSIENEVPQAGHAASKLFYQLPEWFAFAGDVLQNKPKSFDNDGGMYESVGYSNFGIGEALLFRLAWQNAHPNQKSPEIPELAKLPSFFTQTYYTGTSLNYGLNFGDSHRNTVADYVLEMLYASGIKDKNILWYFNTLNEDQIRERNVRNNPIGLLYFPSTKDAPKNPDLPTSQLYTNFGWATMRTSWEKDATMLAVKSGHTWNHSHADANSFTIFHKGYNLLKDAGNCNYPNPEYKDYFFQSQSHNVVLFNGEGQPANQQYEGSILDGKLSNLMDSGNIKYILANGTGPYANNFVRNFRHFLWIDNIIYILDDLKTYKSGKFEWLWHPEGDTKKNGIDINITHQDASLIVRPIYPEYLAPSAFLHDYPSNLYVESIVAPTEYLKEKETYYSFKYPVETNRIKGLTAIILKDSLNDKNLPKIERIEGKDWIGVRVKNKGKITDIIINQLADGRLMHSNSWIEANGWETDAYMFAISYPENGKPEDVSDLFISYGSALRSNGVSYFGSLSKLFVIQKNIGGKTDLLVQGQPLINATFFNPKKPSSLVLNGVKSEVNYTEKQLSIKIDTRK